MKHLGDITKIDWSKVEPVDVVTGGSPCQDLSVAGKRAGLAGERSGLFMEQIRCVKELREADVQRGRTGISIRPRFMVWENVPGAFSSGSPKGSDFEAVIEEIIKVAEPGAVVHVCVPDRGWTKSGCYYAEDGSWSIAWRVHDAQFWGVPQRRKRISLVADFGGLAAPEVLFERKGLCRHLEPSGTAGAGTAGTVEGGSGGAISFQERAGKPGGEGILIQFERTGVLSTLNNQAVCSFHQNASGEVHTSDVGYTVGTSCNASGRNTPLCYDARGNGNGDTVCTLTGDHQNRVTDYTAIVSTYQDVTGPLMANSHPGSYCGQDAYSDMLIAHTLKAKANCDFRADSETYICQSVDCRNGYENTELSGTIQVKGNGGQSLNYINPVRCANIVRRLTPLECERLQGYPDGWTNIGEWVDTKGKKHKEADSPRYKALGNSIALPFWCWMAKRISAQYERDINVGSLFDGIGGFPYAFEKCGAKAVWASEIEEFPIAVTKIRFGED